MVRVAWTTIKNRRKSASITKPEYMGRKVHETYLSEEEVEAFVEKKKAQPFVLNVQVGAGVMF